MAAHACWGIEGGVAKNRILYCGGVVDNNDDCGKHHVYIYFTEWFRML